VAVRLTKRSAAAFAAVLGLASSLVAGATAEDFRHAIVPADRAAARLAVLQLRDIDPTTGWKGGFRPPDRSSGDACPAYHPRRSDLVVTGEARSEFRYRGGVITVFTSAQVFRTRKMMASAWRRELVDPGAEACGRRTVAGAVGPQGRVVSFARIAFPRRGERTLAYRVLIRFGGAVEVLADTIFFARGRTVCSFLQLLPNGPQTPALLRAADLRIVTALAGRITA
jgi:hypothetical protein